jgi:hypothetical protein
VTNSKLLTHALTACQSGTANLGQYSLVFEESVEAGRKRVLASVPALVAREDLGGTVNNDSAVAYPPDVPLPDVIATELDRLYRFATTITVLPATADPETNAAWVWWRAQAALGLLILGGAEAMALRCLAWDHGGEGARPTAEVTRLAVTQGLTPAGCDGFLGLTDTAQSVARAVAAGTIPSMGDDLDRILGRDMVSYDQLATSIRLLGWRGAQPRPVPGLAAAVRH